MKTSPLGRYIVLSLLAATSTLLHGAIATKESTAPHNNHVIDAAASSANNENNEILAALTTQTNKSTQALSEKSAEYTKLQSLLSEKLVNFREHHQQIMMQQAESPDPTTNNAMDNTIISTEAMHESMDEASLKLVACQSR